MDTVNQSIGELNKLCETLLEREQEHGSPDENFTKTATMWSAFLGRPVTALDVSVMLALFKIARISTGKVKTDSYRDLTGYAALATGLHSQK